MVVFGKLVSQGDKKSMNKRLLVVEDDESLRLTLVDNLQLENYEVYSASSLSEARSILLQQRKFKQDIELMVLDLMLPDGSGYDLCAEVKPNYPELMILMLTARTLDSDLHAGFTAGADDYLTKPYKIAELLLRIMALLRRAPSPHQPHNDTNINGFNVSWLKHSITKRGQAIHLTKKEFDLLQLLFENIDQPLHRDEILNQVWGEDIYVEERTVDNFISNVRKALNLNSPKPYYIKTIRGVGYALIKT